jgi:Mg2+ and Co2+ transporter CorA
MGRYERAAKTSLKEATALASGIITTVRHDLRREEVRLEEEMRERVESIQSILNEVASIQDAIIAGSSEIKRELEKAKKKLVKYGDRELMVTQIIGAANRLGELRSLHLDAVNRIQGALARPPSAVDIIERMTKDLLKLSGSWEASAREIDESISDVVDANAPIEMIELQRELSNNGYDLILAGDDRSPENIEKCRAKIRELSGEENSED